MSAKPGVWMLFVCLCTAALCMPYIRTIFSLGDEGIWLQGASRLMRGERLYIDFFELHPPLGFLLLQGWLSAFGTTLLSARLLVVLTFVVIAGATFLASWRAGANCLLSAVIILAWVIFSQGFWTQVNHHWFTSALSMLALVFTLSPAASGACLAGLAVGAAAVVTPLRGFFTLLASSMAFLNQGWKRRTLFLAGTAFMPSVSLLWVFMYSDVEAAYEAVISINAARYSDVQWVPFGYGGTWRTVLVVIAFPVSIILIVVLALNSTRTLLADPSIRTCAFFAFAGFVGCFPRPDVAHILFAIPLAIPFIVTALSRITFAPPVKRLAGVVFVLALAAPSMTYLGRAGSVWNGQTVPTAAGMVTFPKDLSDEVQLIQTIYSDRQDSSILFYPYQPTLTFLTGRRHTARTDIFVPFYTTPQQYYEACTETMATAASVVIDRRRADLEMLRKAYPAMPSYLPRETIEFERAIARSFPVRARVGPLEIGHRSTASSCDGILMRPN